MPVFDGVTDYTRRGDFQVNANGNLVNGAGYYLMGVTVDPKTGNPTGNVPQVLQFQNNFIPAQATTADPLCREPADPAEDAGKLVGGQRHDHRGRRPQPGRLLASNPLPIGTPAPSVDATATGIAVLNQVTTRRARSRSPTDAVGHRAEATR